MIDHLTRVARKIAGGDVENPLPDGFTVRNGVVFYDASDAEDLADRYFEFAIEMQERMEMAKEDA